VKAWVDAERCQGHTLCAMRAPDVFVLSEIDGHSTAIDGEIAGHLHAAVREAQASCPEQAVHVEE
jgi:ferredoxin